MDDAQQRLLQETFDAVAGAYDHPVLRFFANGAEHLAGQLGLRGHERVLDVACGTGHLSLALARHLPHGQVTGVDFSPAMLARARAKASAAGLSNTDFVEADMRTLPWRARFDAAVCAFGIFFVDDMEAQLARLAETVKPGGTVAISTFAADYMDPLRSLLVARLTRFGIEAPPQHWLRIAHPEGCRALFASAGLGAIELESRDMGYFLASAEDWWNVIWNSGFRRLVGRLSAEALPRFREQHLAEVEALRSPEGIRLSIPVLFARVVVPS